jgi:hypothetical protein
LYIFQSHVDIEREQEAKLKAKYGMRKPGGGSALLQKRLQKGVCLSSFYHDIVDALEKNNKYMYK